MSFKTKQTLYDGEYLSQNRILKELIEQKIVGIEQIGNDFYLCEQAFWEMQGKIQMLEKLLDNI